MNSSYNSITAKLYRWFYLTNEMPSNLCPYFWKCVIMYITILPYTIFSLPVILLHLKPKLREFICFKSTFDRVMSAVALYAFLYLIASTIFTLININLLYTEIEFDKYPYIYIPGISVLLTTLVSIIGYLFFITKQKLKYVTAKGKTDNMTLSFIKARYNKYCPKINWVD